MSTPYAIDPELLPALQAIPDVDLTDPAAARTMLSRQLAKSPPADATGVEIHDVRVPGPDGAPDVGLRIYRPAEVRAPALVYDVHGGGMVTGGLDTDHARNIEVARTLGIVVASVDYRLAPDTRFPGGLEDVYAGLKWVATHASDWGADPTRIAINGSSAGGGLCAALALLARDRGGPTIAFQSLSIPMLDDRLITHSMQTFTDTPLWNRPRAEVCWNHYLGRGLRGTDAVSPYAAPARATDLTGLPPAYLSVAQFDPMRDEGMTYAAAMLHAGITVELHAFPGTFHGFAAYPAAAVSRRQLDEQLAVLRRGLNLA